MGRTARPRGIRGGSIKSTWSEMQQLRQRVRDLFETDAVGSLVRPSVRRHFDTTVRHHAGNDLSDLAHAIIVSGGPHVEGLIEDDFFRRFERSDERTGDVLDMRYRPPGCSIRLEIDEPAGDREGR